MPIPKNSKRAPIAKNAGKNSRCGSGCKSKEKSLTNKNEPAQRSAEEESLLTESPVEESLQTEEFLQTDASLQTEESYQIEEPCIVKTAYQTEKGKQEGSQTKGVNVTPRSLPAPTEAKPPVKKVDDKATATYDPKSLEGQLRMVIDLMEPNTPHFTNTQSEMENDLSSTSIMSSIVQVHHHHKHKRDFDRSDKTHEPESSHLYFSKVEENKQSGSVKAQPEALNRSTSGREVSEYSTLHDYEPLSEDSFKNLDFDYPFAGQGQQPPCLCPFMPPYQFQQLQRFQNASSQMVREEHISRQKKFKLQKFYQWIASRRFMRSGSNGKIPVDLYKMNIKEAREEGSPPRQLVFDLVPDIPKPETVTVGTNTKAIEPPKKNPSDIQYPNPGNHGIKRHLCSERPLENKCMCSGRAVDGMADLPVEHVEVTNQSTKVDIYYFDHGNSGYYRTTDACPMVSTEVLAERTERYTSRFWAEVFGTVHVGFAFFTSFILQLLRFLLTALIRPLTVGFFQMLSDYFFKPLLAVLFNAVIQPPLILLYNIFTSLRDLCEPLSEGLGYFLREVTAVLGAVRLFEINKCQKRKQEKDEDCAGGCCTNIKRNSESNLAEEV